MKIYTSYFYQIRFFKPNMLPLSTAIWDPKWYHQFQGADNKFVDKNGVINGMRAEPFKPGPTCEDKCRGPENCPTKDPMACSFLDCYFNQLMQLPIESVKARLQCLGEAAREVNHYQGEPIFVFIVHEAIGNPCSERGAIQRYFTENGITCSELNPKEFEKV